MAAFNLHNSDLHVVTLTVTIPKVFRFRVWLGTKVIIAGAKIIGMGIKIELEQV